ncbi:MAG: hypothetical protein ACXU8N_04415 [Telluria sp.]
MRTSRRQQGQALLLLVAVLGLGAASLFLTAMARPRLDTAREEHTMRLLGEAREALVGFAVTHGRLPRPAVSPTNGSESPLPCANEAACTGYLPWAALGVASADAWGKRLRYSVSPAFTNAPLPRTAAVATKSVLTRRGNGIVYLAGNPDCSLGAQCMAAVVFSQGRNGVGTSDAGIALANANAASIDELANHIAVQNFMSRPATDDEHAPGGPFDDMFTWLDTTTLYGPMTRARVLP